MRKAQIKITKKALNLVKNGDMFIEKRNPLKSDIWELVDLRRA